MKFGLLKKLMPDPYYWGMDVTQYPGDETMKAWKDASPLQFTGFYLAPSPIQSNTSWMDKRTILTEQGWGFASIYQGQQSDSGKLTSGQGALDAQNAAELAQKAGFPIGTYLYLDIQETGAISSEFLTYMNSFARRLLLTGYMPAIYCNYKNADIINDSISVILRFWVANYKDKDPNLVSGNAPNPAKSGVAYASIWQLAENVPKSFGGHAIESVDINSSIYQNPSKS